MPMMQWLQCVEPQEAAYVPLAHRVQRGLCTHVAKLPGEHISQAAALTVVLAQPAGHRPHQGWCDGGTGQPAASHTHRSQVKPVCFATNIAKPAGSAYMDASDRFVMVLNFIEHPHGIMFMSIA